MLVSQKLYEKRDSVTMRNYVETFRTNIDHNLAKKFLARYLSYSKIKSCDPPFKALELDL